MKLEKIAEKLSDEWDNTNPIRISLGLSFILGAGLGAIGKYTSLQEIAAIPPVMDLTNGSTNWTIMPYALGVSMSYLPEIYSALNYLQR